jgi:hypothetical protein
LSLSGTRRRAQEERVLTRIFDSTKHTGAPVVGLPFDYPTVKIPGARQD